MRMTSCFDRARVHSSIIALRAARFSQLAPRLLAGKARVLGKLGPTDRRGEGGPHLLLRGDEGVVIRTTRRTGIGRAWNPASHLVAAPRHGLAKALMVAQAHPD